MHLPLAVCMRLREELIYGMAERAIASSGVREELVYKVFAADVLRTPITHVDRVEAHRSIRRRVRGNQMIARTNVTDSKDALYHTALDQIEQRVIALQHQWADLMDIVTIFDRSVTKMRDVHNLHLSVKEAPLTRACLLILIDQAVSGQAWEVDRQICVIKTPLGDHIRKHLLVRVVIGLGKSVRCFGVEDLVGTATYLVRAVIISQHDHLHASLVATGG